MAGFWTALKNIFTGGGASKAPAAPAAPTTPERFCIPCQKMTAGTLSPKGGGALNFTCSECSKDTQVLA